ncbi:MAG: hypothetical protein IKP24_02735 [Alphaproteobacteria bacterium]|nr:hypothetical protein [Alphaproteobacteria bacterium]
MTVYKTKIFNDMSRGASLIEVVLAISIIAVAAPFMYKQITRTYNDIENISVAQKIVDLQDSVLNFVRTHQENWDGDTEIQLTADDLKEISPIISSGFIDKRQFRGTTITDVYLGFDISSSLLRTNQIARQIGGNAAIVGDDGVAYGNTWAVSGPEFKPGNLIYRVSHNFATMDRMNFLHRGATDTIINKSKDNTNVDDMQENKNNLNAMLRNLNMGGKDLLNVGTLDVNSVDVKNINTTFLVADDVNADAIYFSSGANVQGADAHIDTIRALGDISGFRNITANNLNGNSFSNSGTVITDRATVKNSVRIGNMFKLKSSSNRTISAFTVLNSNSVYTPYVTAGDMVFYGDFGLTVSGELLMSRTAPLKIGNWSFPSNQLPNFSSLKLGRTTISATPDKQEFSAIMAADWQTKKSIDEQ